MERSRSSEQGGDGGELQRFGLVGRGQNGTESKVMKLESLFPSVFCE